MISVCALSTKIRISPAIIMPATTRSVFRRPSYVIYTDMYDTALCGNAEILGHSREPFFNRAPEHFCSHKHTPFKMEDHAPAAVLGADGGYIAWNVFEEYAKVGSIILKDTVLRMLDALLAEKKTVVTNLPAQGVVS